MDAMDDQWVFRGREVDWGGAENLTALCGREVALRLESLCDEGRALSYKRQVLRGRTDFIRTESIGRDFVALSPGELVRLGLESVPARIPATDSARDLP
jgi:hypothetical protein